MWRFYTTLGVVIVTLCPALQQNLSVSNTEFAKSNTETTNTPDMQLDISAGYYWLKGDCSGRNLYNMKTSFEECITQCSQLFECHGFAFINVSVTPVKGTTCWLKTEMCNEPTPHESDLYMYYKNVTQGSWCISWALMESSTFATDNYRLGTHHLPPQLKTVRHHRFPVMSPPIGHPLKS